MITFEPSDIKRPALEALAKEIVTAVLKYRSRSEDITAFLKRSGNTLDSYNRFYKDWSSRFNKRKHPADVLEFSALLGKIGTVCTDDKEWRISCTGCTNNSDNSLQFMKIHEVR